MDYFFSAKYAPTIIGQDIFMKISKLMPQIIFILRTQDLKVLFANQHAHTLLGYTQEDYDKMDNILIGAGSQALGDKMAKLLAILDKPDTDSSEPMIVESPLTLNHKEGREIHFDSRWTAFERDESGAVTTFLALMTDMTQQRQEEARVQRNLMKLKEAETSQRMGTWEWDMEKNLVKWSDGFWRLLDYDPQAYSREWMPVQNYLDHVLPEDMPNSEQAIRDGLNLVDSDEYISQNKLSTKKGRTLHVLSHTKVIERKDGKPTRSIGSTSDVTEMKLIQQNLEAKIKEVSLAYEASEEFSYVASHDLQEPLRKITNFGERLKTKCYDSLNGDGQLYLDRMMDAAARMRVLIEDLLELSRTKRHEEHFKPIDLNEVFDYVKNDLMFELQQRDAILQVEKLPIIEAIPTQIGQLFLNIVGNALKFSKKDEVPTIKIDNHALSRIEKENYKLSPDKEYTLITIKDQGIGFEEIYAETIFVPFKRLHGRSEYKGTGIGLAICKKVAQNHNGLLWAESKPGEGSTFFIILPIHQ